MQLILKILLVIAIVLIGWAVTCGWNLFIDSLLPSGLYDYNSDYTGWLFLLWFLEIIGIIYFAIRYEFYKKNPISLKTQGIILLIIILFWTYFFFWNWALYYI